MARPKKIKINPSEKVITKLSEISAELKIRGAQDFNLSDIFDDLFECSEAENIFNQFVDRNTPETFKIDQLLKIPSERQRILELIGDRSFGLDSGDKHGTHSSAQV